MRPGDEGKGKGGEKRKPEQGSLLQQKAEGPGRDRPSASTCCCSPTIEKKERGETEGGRDPELPAGRSSCYLFPFSCPSCAVVTVPGEKKGKEKKKKEGQRPAFAGGIQPLCPPLTSIATLVLGKGERKKRPGVLQFSPRATLEGFPNLDPKVHPICGRTHRLCLGEKGKKRKRADQLSPGE